MPRPRADTPTLTRLAGAQAKALQRVHALLDEEQRKTFAYLLRTGVLGRRPFPICYPPRSDRAR